MLTEFGKFNRKLRIDKGELLKDMAKKLGVTVAYLSAVEVGRRKIPEKWLSMLAILYDLSAEDTTKMYSAYYQSIDEIKINLSNQSPSYREIATMFARELNSLTESELKVLLRKMHSLKSKRNERSV